MPESVTLKTLSEQRWKEVAYCFCFFHETAIQNLFRTDFLALSNL